MDKSVPGGHDDRQGHNRFLVRPWPRSGQGHSASEQSLTAFACRNETGLTVASPGSGRGPMTQKTHADNRQVLIGDILVPALFYLLS